MPARRGVLKWDRPWIVAVLTFQAGVGAAPGIELLVVGIIGYVMPSFGLELLDMARDVAALNMPARVAAAPGKHPVAAAVKVTKFAILRIEATA